MQILSVLSCPLLPPLAIQQLCLIHKGLIAITAAPPLPGFCVKSFRHLFFFFFLTFHMIFTLKQVVYIIAGKIIRIYLHFSWISRLC